MFFRQSEPTAALRTTEFSLRQSDGVTPFTGALSGADVKLSKAGGLLANAVGVATNLASSGLYKLVLDANDLDTLGVLVLEVLKTGVQTIDMIIGQVVPWNPYDVIRLGLSGIRPDAVLVGHAVTGTLTATQFTTDLTLPAGSLANEAHWRFTSGTLAGQVQKITGYTSVGGTLTFATGFSAPPSNGDAGVLVNG